MVLGYIFGMIDHGVHPQIILAVENLSVWTMHTNPRRSSLPVPPHPPFADIWQLLLHVVASRSTEQCDACRKCARRENKLKSARQNTNDERGG
jgi:hypothetical protein